MGYTIWLEFEEYAESEPPEDEFCNIAVTYDDGRHQGYEVWAIDYFRERVSSILARVESDGFATMPDFVVSKLSREHITYVLEQALPRE